MSCCTVKIHALLLLLLLRLQLGMEDGETIDVFMMQVGGC